MSTVHILAPDLREEAVNRTAAIVGFQQMGAEVAVFERLSFDALALVHGDIVVGGIGFAHRAFERLGIAVPALPIMPEGLMSFAGRSIWETTMADVRRRVQCGTATFIKPLPERHKLFPGQRVGSVRDLIATAAVDDTEIVACSDVVDFISEYRCFVQHGEIIGVRHYKGDPLVFPAPQVVRDMAQAYDKAPAGYSLDVGVLDNGETRVVEVNDGYASAPYGLSPLRYASVIRARWDELGRGVQATT